jgi:hypothetical protein
MSIIWSIFAEFIFFIKSSFLHSGNFCIRYVLCALNLLCCSLFLFCVLYIWGEAEIIFVVCRLFCKDRFCGLVVSVLGYRSRGPGFDSRRYQIFWEVVGLERGPFSFVSITEELLEWKSSGSGSRKQRLTAVRIRCADYATPPIRKSWH